MAKKPTRKAAPKKTMQKKATPKKAVKSRAKPPSDTKLVRKLAKILNETGLTEIEMEKGELKIRVSKGGGQILQAAAPSAPIAAAAPAPSASQPVAAPAALTEKEDAGAHPGAVKSPMVGTAYTRPSPDADAFVKVGDSVKEGDTVMLVEAMKTFNPITAPKSGKVEEIFVQDAQPVEFGEVLFIIA